MIRAAGDGWHWVGNLACPRAWSTPFLALPNPVSRLPSSGKRVQSEPGAGGCRNVDHCFIKDHKRPSPSKSHPVFTGKGRPNPCRPTCQGPGHHHPPPGRQAPHPPPKCATTFGLGLGDTGQAGTLHHMQVGNYEWSFKTCSAWVPRRRWPVKRVSSAAHYSHGIDSSIIIRRHSCHVKSSPLKCIHQGLLSPFPRALLAANNLPWAF